MTCSRCATLRNMVCFGCRGTPRCGASAHKAEPSAASASASASNGSGGICGGPLWRTPKPCRCAGCARPSRRRWPIACMCAMPSTAGSFRSVASAEAIATAPH